MTFFPRKLTDDGLASDQNLYSKMTRLQTLDSYINKTLWFQRCLKISICCCRQHNFIQSKNKVASEIIPRLELSRAALLVKLVNAIKTNTDYNIYIVQFVWRMVLSYLHGFKTTQRGQKFQTEWRLCNGFQTSAIGDM